MSDIPTGIEYLTVTAEAIEALADSIDVGAIPDSAPLAAKVLFEPVGIPPERPFLVDAVSKKFVVPRKILGRLVNGVLYGPNDGSAPVTAETSTGLGFTIVNPHQARLDWQGWAWKVTISPEQPAVDKWTPFSVTFDAPTEDDGTVNLAMAALQETNLNAAQQPMTWIVEGTTIPALAQPGQFLLDIAADPWFLYQIGA